MGLVPLSKVEIQLSVKGRETRESDRLNSELQLYHRVILRRPPTRGIHPDQRAAIEQQAQTLGVTTSALIMASLLNHRLAGPKLREDFHAVRLTGEGAANCLNTFRKECVTKRASFDCGVLAEVYGIPAEHNIFFRLNESEKLASEWAVRSTLNNPSTSLNDLYDLYELDLDPWWLATEQSYLTWLNNDTEGTSSEKLRDHRKKVRTSLKSPAFQAALKTREAMVRECVLMVARGAKMNTDHVLVNPVITRATRLWKILAHALAARDALNILESA